MSEQTETHEGQDQTQFGKGSVPLYELKIWPHEAGAAQGQVE